MPAVAAYNFVLRCTETDARHRIFGVPIFVVNSTRFWGNDRLDVLSEAPRTS